MSQYGVSFVATITAYDSAAGTYKTGDAANIALRWVKDGTSAATTNSCSEVDSTNEPGVYKITLTAAEASCLVGKLCGKSSTATTIIITGQEYSFVGSGVLDAGTASALPDSTHLTLAAASFGTDTLKGRSMWIQSAGTAGAGQVVTITGNTNASPSVVAFDAPGTTLSGAVVYQIFAQASPSSSVPIPVNPVQWNGTAVATPATAGIPEVNVKNVNNVSASGVTTVNPNVGTTQPLNFTGSAGSALVKGDAVDWAGGAIPSPAVTGVPKTDLTYMLGTLFSESAAGRLVAGIKKFFNIATPTLTVGGVDQSGDSFALIGTAGAGLTGVPDLILARNQKGGSNGPAGQTVADCLASGAMNFSISAGVLTVKNADGTTAFTKNLTRANLQAIISSL